MNTSTLASLDTSNFLETSRNLETAAVAFEKDAMERDLYRFLQKFWPVVEPEQVFQPNWHLKALCAVLEDVWFGRRKRVIINVPPGTAKSLTVDVFFPCWAWAKNSRKRFLFFSYGQHLTVRDNVRSRKIVDSELFKKYWPEFELTEDQNTKTRFNTNNFGWRIASSVNGIGTGEHPDFISINDPLSAKQAESDTERKVVNDWYDNTISTRLGRNPVILVTMQRLHVDDLVGHLLKKGGWELVRWPMRFEKCTCPREATPDQLCVIHKADRDWVPDKLDPRTEPGELLFPALFPEEKVKQLEKDLGPQGAAAQLQERPTVAGGNMFKRHWFKVVDAAPANLQRKVRGWDTATKQGGGDWTVGVLMAEEYTWEVVEKNEKKVRTNKPTGRVFILNVVRDQLSPAGVDALMRAVAESDGKDVAVREEKEKGGAGASAISAHTILMKGFDYKGVVITGNKALRARPFRAQAEAGNVYLVRGSWNEPYLDVLANFPTGDHDDDVDGSSTAYNSMSEIQPYVPTSCTF